MDIDSRGCFPVVDAVSCHQRQRETFQGGRWSLVVLCQDLGRLLQIRSVVKKLVQLGRMCSDDIGVKVT